jgi:hypothetical protein
MKFKVRNLNYWLAVGQAELLNEKINAQLAESSRETRDLPYIFTAYIPNPPFNKLEKSFKK